MTPAPVRTFLNQTGRANQDALRIYLFMTRSVLEYACPAWHGSLTKAKVERVESTLRRALRILYAGQSYARSLCTRKFEYPCTLHQRREELYRAFFTVVWWTPVTVCTACCLRGELWCEHWENRNSTRWSGTKTCLSRMDCHSGTMLGLVAQCMFQDLGVDLLGPAWSFPLTLFCFYLLSP